MNSRKRTKHKFDAICLQFYDAENFRRKKVQFRSSSENEQSLEKKNNSNITGSHTKI
jgi:hypothetical protein